MKIVIESTEDFVEIPTSLLVDEGMEFTPCRIWHGMTDSGIACVVFVMALQPQTDDEEKLREFEQELQVIPTIVPLN
jgi:hypothetical protein